MSTTRKKKWDPMQVMAVPRIPAGRALAGRRQPAVIFNVKKNNKKPR